MPNQITKEELHFLYIEQGLTETAIAKIYNTEQTRIGRLRKKYYIPTISRSERFEYKAHIPTQRQVEIIYGTLMGDAHLSKDGRDNSKRKPVLEIKHSIKKYNQSEYIDWLYYELSPLVTSPKLTNQNTQLRIRSRSNPFLTSIRNKLYSKQGKKIISKGVLKKLTILSLAVWYMDDGSLQSKGAAAKLCTHGFSYEENILIRDWLSEKFNIEAKIQQDRHYYYIHFNKSAAQQLWKLIIPYIIPSMQYKIGPI